MPFHVGEVVVDREDDDTRVVVLDPDIGRAEEVFVDDIDATIAAVNPEYPAADPVVECVHVDWLDRHAGDHWNQWEGETFTEQLETFADQWNLSIARYAYPATRLAPAESAPGEESSDAGSDGQSSIDDWAD